MAYETDMAIFFDAVDKTVFVSFRGKFKILPGPYRDRKAGVTAGEKYCRERGWAGSKQSSIRKGDRVRVHFTFNEGEGVQHDGTQDYPSIAAAKRDALLALAQSLQEDVRTTGAIVGAVAGIDEQGNALFSVSMHVTIEDEPHRPETPEG